MLQYRATYVQNLSVIRASLSLPLVYRTRAYQLWLSYPSFSVHTPFVTILR